MKHVKKKSGFKAAAALSLALATSMTTGALTGGLMPVHAMEQGFEEGNSDFDSNGGSSFTDASNANTNSTNGSNSSNANAGGAVDGWVEDLDLSTNSTSGGSNANPDGDPNEFSGTVNGNGIGDSSRLEGENTINDQSGHMGASLEETDSNEEQAAQEWGYTDEMGMIGDIDNHRQSSTVLDGIDISHWQKTIDLDLINADFIICKATGGTGFIDRSFDYFAQKILDSGRLFGFYHFANDSGYEGTPQEEAKFFYQQTEQYIGKGIPILDFEDHDVLTKGASWALEFLETYYQLSGVKPMLYTSSHYTRTIDWTPVAKAGYPLWVANYGKNDEQQGYRETAEVRTDMLGTGAFDEYYMHQYTSRGKLDGYEGNLDLNKFYGTKDEWRMLSQPEGVSKTLLRLYNPNSGEHFYTSSREEKRILTSVGWMDEGLAWTTPRYGKNVYRLYNPNSGDHHYTVDVNERDTLISLGWKEEGIGWLAVEDRKKGIPVYRAYNPNAETGAHHFTTSVEEINALVAMGWENEGVAWYAVDPNAPLPESAEELEEIELKTKLQRLRPFKNAALY